MTMRAHHPPALSPCAAQLLPPSSAPATMPLGAPRTLRPHPVSRSSASRDQLLLWIRGESATLDPAIEEVAASMTNGEGGRRRRPGEPRRGLATGRLPARAGSTLCACSRGAAEDCCWVGGRVRGGRGGAETHRREERRPKDACACSR